MLLQNKQKKSEEKHRRIEEIMQAVIGILFVLAFILFFLSSFKTGDILLSKISKENNEVKLPCSSSLENSKKN